MKKEADALAYLRILNKHKKVIFSFGLFLVALTFIFFLFSGGDDATSIISIGGEKGNLQNIALYELYLKSPTILAQVSNQTGIDNVGQNIRTRLLRERVDRTGEHVLSFIEITTGGKDEQQSELLNEVLISTFLSQTNPLFEYERNISLAKIAAYDEEINALEQDKAYVEEALLKSITHLNLTEKIINDFKEDVQFYTESIGRGPQNDQERVDLVQLYKLKIDEDIGTFRTYLKKSEHEKSVQEEASTLLSVLEDFSSYLEKPEQTDITNLVRHQEQLENALRAFEGEAVGNSSTRVFTEEEAMDKLLSLRSSLTEAKITYEDARKESLDKKHSYSLLSAPQTSQYLRPSATSIIRVSAGEDAYRILEAERILKSTAVIAPVIEKYALEMNAGSFVVERVHIERKEITNENRRTELLPVLYLTVEGDSPEEALTLNQAIIDSFFAYMKEFTQYQEEQRLAEEKVATLAESVMQKEADIRLFEDDLYRNNLENLQKLPPLTLKLLISDITEQVGKAKGEKLTVQETFFQESDFRVLSSTDEDLSERLSPTQKGFYLFFLFLIGIFVGGFAVIFYEMNWPELRKRIGKFKQLEAFLKK